MRTLYLTSFCDEQFLLLYPTLRTSLHTRFPVLCCPLATLVMLSCYLHSC